MERNDSYSDRNSGPMTGGAADYACLRCGASWSLPLGSECDGHQPVPIPKQNDTPETKTVYVVTVSCATYEEAQKIVNEHTHTRFLIYEV
jgi:hypothetical protein